MGKLIKKAILFRWLILFCWGGILTTVIILNMKAWNASAPAESHTNLKQSSKLALKNLPHDNCTTQDDNREDEEFVTLGCRERHCSELLTRKEKIDKKKCAREVYRFMDPFDIKKELKANNCHFIDGTTRLPVALVSAEGSGNTWLRGLLEKATGICTGFIHCDYMMRMKGFVGESIKSGSVIVAKTHAIEPRWMSMNVSHLDSKEPAFGSAVFLLRNPYKSIVAEWNRQVTNLFLIPNGLEHNESHTNVVPDEYWRIPEWNDFVIDYTEAWYSRIQNWLAPSYSQVHMVLYEDLERDATKEVVKILDFLNIAYASKKNISRRICSGYPTFKRPHTRESIVEHFTSEQVHYMQSVIQEAKTLMLRAGREHFSFLDTYNNNYLSPLN